jgi:1,2-diacylglycerol 3-beta-galactosyltransferase
MSDRAPVDVLFAVSDTGGGHRSAAVAVSAALDLTTDRRVSWAIDDLLSATEVPGVRDAPGLYDQLSTRWLRLYNLTFRLTNARATVNLLSRLVFLAAGRNLGRLLAQRRPKVVVVTHPLVHRLVGAARSQASATFRVVTVVTDLVSLHASWTYPGVDLAIVPTDEAFALMRRRGMPATRMQRTGFPVHPRFTDDHHTRAEARRLLNLDVDRRTILLTAGGVGSGRLGELVNALERELPGRQLLVVTARNRALYDELRNSTRSPHTHVYGFVDTMPDLMAASDTIVTKAGPGTLMEALVMRKPVIVTEAVGVQEVGNIDFVVNHQLGEFCPRVPQIVEALQRFEDQSRYLGMVERLQHAVPRDGAREIAALVQEQLQLPDRPQRRRADRRRFNWPV